MDVGYDKMIAAMQNTSDGRSWTYQTCIEFGYFQTGDSPAGVQPFSPLISLDFYVQQCADIFGVEGLTPDVNWTNEYYGGAAPVTSNTVFTNGDVDPWHILGTYETFEPAALSESILMHGTAHCADLYAPMPNDLPILTATRARQNELLTQWLAVEAAPKAHPKAHTKPHHATVEQRKRAKIMLSEL
jgi:serine protease 16